MEADKPTTEGLIPGQEDEAGEQRPEEKAPGQESPGQGDEEEEQQENEKAKTKDKVEDKDEEADDRRRDSEHDRERERERERDSRDNRRDSGLSDLRDSSRSDRVDRRDRGRSPLRRGGRSPPRDGRSFRDGTKDRQPLARHLPPGADDRGARGERRQPPRSWEGQGTRSWEKAGEARNRAMPPQTRGEQPADPLPPVDRSGTCPLLLRVFLCEGRHFPIEEFGRGVPIPPPALILCPPHHLSLLHPPPKLNGRSCVYGRARISYHNQAPATHRTCHRPNCSCSRMRIRRSES